MRKVKLSQQTVSLGEIVVRLSENIYSGVKIC